MGIFDASRKHIMGSQANSLVVLASGKAMSLPSSELRVLLSTRNFAIKIAGLQKRWIPDYIRRVIMSRNIPPDLPIEIAGGADYFDSTRTTEIIDTLSKPADHLAEGSPVLHSRLGPAIIPRRARAMSKPGRITIQISDKLYDVSIRMIRPLVLLGTFSKMAGISTDIVSRILAAHHVKPLWKNEGENGIHYYDSRAIKLIQIVMRSHKPKQHHTYDPSLVSKAKLYMGAA